MHFIVAVLQNHRKTFALRFLRGISLRQFVYEQLNQTKLSSRKLSVGNSKQLLLAFNRHRVEYLVSGRFSFHQFLNDGNHFLEKLKETHEHIFAK